MKTKTATWTKIVFCSLTGGLGACACSENALANHYDALYVARVAAGGELSPMDVGFAFWVSWIAVSLLGAVGSGLLAWLRWERQQKTANAE